MRSTWLVIAAVARMRVAPRLSEHVAPVRQSLHAASPADFAAHNAATLRRVPESLAGEVIPDDRPAVRKHRLKAGERKGGGNRRRALQSGRLTDVRHGRGDTFWCRLCR